MKHWIGVSLSLLLLLSSWSVTALAQKAEGSTEGTSADAVETPVGKVEQGIADLETLAKEIDSLIAEHKRSAGPERAALWEQITRKRASLRETLDKLIKELAVSEKDGKDVSEQRKRAVAFSQRVASALRDDIERVRGDIRKSMQELPEATPEDQPAIYQRLKQDNADLDLILEEFLNNTRRQEALGLDNAADITLLTEILQKRADTLAGEIQLNLNERKTISQRMAGLPEEERKALEPEHRASDEQVRALSANLSATVKLMEESGLETSEYKQLLIEATGEITEDIFEADVAFSLLQRWTANARDWAIEEGPALVFKLLVVIFILFAFKILANFVRRIVQRAIQASRLQFSQLLQDFFVSLAAKGVMLLGILIALSQLGFQLGPLLAGLGVAGFIIGFALQDTLSNFAAGMMILIYRPYDVGDAVEAGGVMGTVGQMSLVSTTILTWDNQKLVVPNSKIWGDVIRNITAEEKRRVDLVFGIGYNDDIEHAERVLAEIINSHELVLKDPQPVIKLHTLGESSVDFVVRPWVKTADYWTVYWDITRAVKMRFDAEGISIPFPQRDVHLYQAQANGTSANPAGAAGA